MPNPKDYANLPNRPGKFQGEPGATRYFYELIQWGAGEEVDNGDLWFSVFTVDSDEAQAFGDGYPEGSIVVVWEDDNGFAYSRQFADIAAANAFMGVA